MMRVGVLGAGAAGQALTAILCERGYQVSIWGRGSARTRALTFGPITLSGAIELRATPTAVESDPQKAVVGCDVVVVATPASAQGGLLRRIGPVLRADTPVLLMPGRTGGAIEAVRVLASFGLPAPGVGETDTFFAVCRSAAAGRVEVLATKSYMKIAGFWAEHQRETVSTLLQESFDGAVEWTDSTLDTGLANMGAVLHPGPLLRRAESGSEQDSAWTPEDIAVVAAVDQERLAVGQALGLGPVSVSEWLSRQYEVPGSSLTDALTLNTVYAKLGTPRHTGHRYVTEEVPTGLVPLEVLGAICGVPTPTISGLIDLANSIRSTDYRADGRNATRLGITGSCRDEVLAMFRNGPGTSVQSSALDIRTRQAVPSASGR